MPPRPRPEPSQNRRPAKARPQNRRSGSPDKRGRRPDQAAESRGGRMMAARPVASEAESTDEPDTMRLQKFLAMAGVDSRRNCEEYIRTGRVTVDSEVVTDPARAVNPNTQDIRVDSERLRMPRFRYFLVNKPKGVLCTNSDPMGRPRAVDLVPVTDQRLFTVGRLDENTEGMLLLTNDGDLAQKLAHPRFQVVRRYRCHVAGIPQPDTLNQLRDGMYFAEGYFKFRSVHIFKRKGQSAILELELQEGKNREIRRLMARVGHKVLALERVAFGPLSLGSLAPGRHRELQPFEIHELRHFAENGEKPEVRTARSKDGFGYRSGQTRSRRRRPDSAPERPPRREVAAPERTPVERPRVERQRVERTPVERPRVERKPVERKPVERKPVERKPVERPRVERPPVERSLSDRSPAERTPRAPRPSIQKPAKSRPAFKKTNSKKAGAKKTLKSAAQKPVSPIGKGRDRRRNK